MSEDKKIKILIIGAGASGSFLACLLDDEKYDVTTYEGSCGYSEPINDIEL